MFVVVDIHTIASITKIPKKKAQEGGVAVASRKGAKRWIHVKHALFPIAQKIIRYAWSAEKRQVMKIDQQITLDMIDDDYKQFVEKFKPKKTTDDCYTPENVYTAVVQWARDQYGIDPANIVRPFWPGGGLRGHELSGRMRGSGQSAVFDHNQDCAELYSSRSKVFPICSISD